MARTVLRQFAIATWLTIATATAAPDASGAEAHTDRVRFDSAVIGALIERATQGSETFRRMVDGINESDGIVYVQEGVCPDDGNGCIVGITPAGLSRILWIRVNVSSRRDDCDVMGSLGHELRHVLEILEVRSLRSTAEMQLFYGSVGFQGSARGYETLAALHAGAAVRSELRASTRRGKGK